MRIFVNEKEVFVPPGRTAFQIREEMKADADVLVMNGFIISQDQVLAENDELVLIKKGEIPSQDEMEALLFSRHTPGVHKKIKQAFVGIAGLGGLGSNVAISLARLGIGKLLLVDHDVVEPSNLNRQQFFVEQLGMYKTHALQEILEKINPFMEIETKNLYLDQDNIRDCFHMVDILVEAFDSPQNKAVLVNTALKELPRTPIVAASGLAGHFSSNTIQTKKLMGNLYMIGDDWAEAKPGCGLMAPRVGIAANHQANMVLRLIMGEETV